MNNEAKSSWQVSISNDGLSDMQIELLQFHLNEAGANGILSEDDCFIAYFNTDKADLDQLLAGIHEEIPFSCEVSALEDKNWLLTCAEVWQRVRLGSLEIVPTLLDEVPKEKEDNQIILYPSTGFGTGHHSTSKMLLLLLQHEKVKALQAKRVLDLGTGSGILAIAAQILFQASIDAIDNDASALRNAEVNVGLNSGFMQGGSIDLKLGSLEHLAGPYDLSIANLYAELLTSMAEKLVGATRSGGLILLSGILKHHWEAVEEVYLDLGCTLVSEMLNSQEFEDTDGEREWKAAFFEKN